jgi:hypothetical protein
MEEYSWPKWLEFPSEHPVTGKYGGLHARYKRVPAFADVPPLRSANTVCAVIP